MSLVTQTVPGSYGVFAATVEEVLAAAGDTTSWVGLHGQLAVQITGDASQITLQVERSTRRPTRTVEPNTAPAGEPISGDPSAGIQTCAYTEPGIAWWRVRCVSIEGGSAVVAINGLGV
ncbi:MAG: hypothetical protein J7521_20940 [Caulobacter sp.]|nr:hypothetical protein [Caulobacter sp.]